MGASMVITPPGVEDGALAPPAACRAPKAHLDPIEVKFRQCRIDLSISMISTRISTPVPRHRGIGSWRDAGQIAIYSAVPLIVEQHDLPKDDEAHPRAVRKGPIG